MAGMLNFCLETRVSLTKDKQLSILIEGKWAGCGINWSFLSVLNSANLICLWSLASLYIRWQYVHIPDAAA